MSSAGNEAREWRFYVTDMIEFGEKVRAYTAEMDQAAFVADARTYDAVLRNLELIGEAATHVPVTLRNAHPEIPGARSSNAKPLGSGYLTIDDDLVWTMIEDAIPALLPALRRFLEMIGEGRG